MKRPYITTGEYYHLMNRGNQKQIIFRDNRDRLRFLFLILYFQSGECSFEQIGRYTQPVLNRISDKLEQNPFKVREDITSVLVQNRYVELIAFSLMPNHFHILVQETREKGIQQYMQRILISYTKYFNTKYDQSGHLFQGPYKARLQKDESHLFYTSAYIHRNPYELKGWKRKEHLYPWSSYMDYIKENRWGELLENSIIRKQFKTGHEYKEYVDWTDIKGGV